METNNTAVKAEKISISEKIAYGGGDLASNLILVLSSTFVAFFYTEALHLNIGIVGTIMMVSRFLDGFSDIIMGFIMDKTKSKHGKARPWILWLAAPIAISLVLMFLVPNIGETGKYIYVAITYNLVTTILYTAINIPYGALNSLMTRDQNQRMVINVFRMVMAQVGSLIINMLTLPLVNALGGSTNQKSWIIASVIYGLLAMALFYACFFKTKERVHVESANSTHLSFMEELKICFKNDQWLIIVGVWVVMAFGMGGGMSVGNYYAKYVLGNENLAGLITAASLLPAIILMPFLPPLTEKFGKRNCGIVGGVITACADFAMLTCPTSFTGLLILNIVKGIGSTALTGTIFAMVADTIEYGQWKTGVRTEGMLYSSTTFGAKIGAGVGAAFAMNLLASVGYVEGAATQGAAVHSMLIKLFILLPAIFTVIQIILFVFYKLDKLYPQVMKDLLEREAKN